MTVSIEGSAEASSRNPKAAAQSPVTKSSSPEAERVTIVAIGDSLGNGLWEGLHLRFRKDKRMAIVAGAKHSVGFADSDMVHQIDAAFAQGAVDALVIMIGANDDRRSFFSGGKSLALFASERWAKLYSQRVEAFMDHAGKRHAPLVWVLLPVMRTPEATKAAKLTNDIIVKAAASRPFVSLVPTWHVTADETGAYLAHFNDLTGRKRLMRHSDGLHFTRQGYEVLAQLTTQKLQEVSPRFRAIVSQGEADQDTAKVGP